MFEIFNETNEKIEEINDMTQVLNVAIKQQQLDNIEFNVIIVDNEYIHNLNRDYRKIDRPTDVITFALEDYEDIKLEHRMLGDIYISIDKAHEQAQSYGHSLKREICYLAVHGFLHLLGIDHMNETDEKEKFGLQEVILNEANIRK